MQANSSSKMSFSSQDEEGVTTIGLGLRDKVEERDVDSSVEKVHRVAVRMETRKILLHIVHTSETFGVTDLPVILRIVSKMIEHADLLRQKLCATVLQVGCIDPAVLMAKDVFVSMTNVDNFYLVSTDEDAKRVLNKHRK